MSSVKQTPLGINLLGSLLSSSGLTINPVTLEYIGSSKTNTQYNPGKLVTDTVLRYLTFAINDGYTRGPGNGNQTLTDATYDNLISIGSDTVPALGNAKPASYKVPTTTNKWVTAGTPATTGYSISGNIGQGQAASWLPYDTTNANSSVTQWGYLRLHALQGWNEFNWNGSSPTLTTPNYSDFCGSFMTAKGFCDYVNNTIRSAAKSREFLDGVYSNMNDLCSADIAGISLATEDFGRDLERLGDAMSLKDIASFGMPSNLLRIICNKNALISDLGLALLASGVTHSEITTIREDRAVMFSVEKEQEIYGAFLIITGENLQEILAALHCKTRGIETLADLLNVKKLFPTSYASLTVPMYNGVLGLPTNSKTYYPIYQDGAVNATLSTPAMRSYVGSLIPPGKTFTTESTLSPSNYAQIPEGFDSYLDGIIPPDQAVAAGAFSFTMRQVPNIETLKLSRFAKAVKGIELMTGLDLVNGTSTPTNQTAIASCIEHLAIGSGPHGTVTISDLFGSMTGLPYAWKLLFDRMTTLQTARLETIYQQLYLATTWEQATVEVVYDTNPGPTYTVTGINITSPGGGYGRGSAPVPTITISDGSTATVSIGTDTDSLDTYGRVTDVILTSVASPTSTIPTATIQAPPIDSLLVDAAGNPATTGTNYPSGTTGWSLPMNQVVQDLIDQANAEITSIAALYANDITHINAYWNTLGEQLVVEQQTRYNAIPPVSLLESDNFINPPMTVIPSYVDSLMECATDTLPHMSAQTLEAIADMKTLGGQSQVGAMRQIRNRMRLHHCGISLDDDIDDKMSTDDKKTLLTNGTIRGGLHVAINGYTNPAWPLNTMSTGETVSPVPNGRYIPDEFSLTGEYQQGITEVPGDITPLLNDTEVAPAVSPIISIGQADSPVDNEIVVIEPPEQLNPDNVPVELDPVYAATSVLPSSLTVSTAIDDVTVCNCECWIE